MIAARKHGSSRPINIVSKPAGAAALLFTIRWGPPLSKSEVRKVPESQRSDARQNRAVFLAVAEQEVAIHGAQASMEQIARIAGVGSATVRRHFPTRYALLEAVSRRGVETLRASARNLAERSESSEALLDWLTELLTYSISSRGLAAALAYDPADSELAQVTSCADKLEDAARPLLARAIAAKEVAPSVTVEDLLTLIIGISLATENQPDRANRALRLLQLTVTGIRSKLSK